MRSIGELPLTFHNFERGKLCAIASESRPFLLLHATIAVAGRKLSRRVVFLNDNSPTSGRRSTETKSKYSYSRQQSSQNDYIMGTILDRHYHTAIEVGSPNSGIWQRASNTIMSLPVKNVVNENRGHGSTQKSLLIATGLRRNRVNQTRQESECARVRNAYQRTCVMMGQTCSDRYRCGV